MAKLRLSGFYLLALISASISSVISQVGSVEMPGTQIAEMVETNPNSVNSSHYFCWNGTTEVRATDLQTHQDKPAFKGYISRGVAVRMCAPKPGQRCAGLGYCAPGSYCVHDNATTFKGTCACIPRTVLSNSTGMCECIKGDGLNADGVCPGGEMYDDCKSNFDCGLDTVSKTPLLCVQGKCHCDMKLGVPSRIFMMNTRHETYAAHLKPKDVERHDIFHALCAPLPGEHCVGRGYCAPRAFCNFTSPLRWSGTCQCMETTVKSPVTGHCDCEVSHIFDSSSNRCRRIDMSASDDFFRSWDSSDEDYDDVFPSKVTTRRTMVGTTRNPLATVTTQTAATSTTTLKTTLPTITPITQAPITEAPITQAPITIAEISTRSAIVPTIRPKVIIPPDQSEVNQDPADKPKDAHVQSEAGKSGVIYLVFAIIVGTLVVGSATVMIRKFLKKRRNQPMTANPDLQTEDPYFPLI